MIQNHHLTNYIICIKENVLFRQYFIWFLLYKYIQSSVKWNCYTSLSRTSSALFSSSTLRRNSSTPVGHSRSPTEWPAVDNVRSLTWDRSCDSCFSCSQTFFCSSSLSCISSCISSQHQPLICKSLTTQISYKKGLLAVWCLLAFSQTGYIMLTELWLQLINNAVTRKYN